MDMESPDGRAMWIFSYLVGVVCVPHDGSGVSVAVIVSSLLERNECSGDEV